MQLQILKSNIKFQSSMLSSRKAGFQVSKLYIYFAHQYVKADIQSKMKN